MARPFRRCKALGHAWDEIPPGDVTLSQRMRNKGGVWFVFRCTECHSVRWDRRNRNTYALEGRSYDHPDGYQYAEKISRAQLFREIAAERKSARRRRAA